MPRYAITEKAGRFVAGTNNTGVGTVLNLTEKQAEHDVRLGVLQPLDVVSPPDGQNTVAADGQNTVSTEDEPQKAAKGTSPKGANK